LFNSKILPSHNQILLFLSVTSKTFLKRMTTSAKIQKGHHALILGASGITGWAIMKATLSYPSNDTFERVTGLTNRLLSIEDALLPNDSRLQLYAGLDLSKETSEILEYLMKIDGIGETTHVYFACIMYYL
jgi:hypothetical protein